MESGSVKGRINSQNNKNFANSSPRSGSEDSYLTQATRLDPNAFDAIYQKYFPAIYRYLCVRGETPEDSADLTQQVFIKAFTKFSSYQDRGLPLSAWLMGIARNCATDSFRQKRKFIDLDKVSEQTFFSEKQDPESTFLRTEELYRMHNLISQLPPKKKELVAFRFAAGLTIKEIGLILGKKDATIKKQLSRIVNLLKDKYQEQEL